MSFAHSNYKYLFLIKVMTMLNKMKANFLLEVDP